MRRLARSQGLRAKRGFRCAGARGLAVRGRGDGLSFPKAGVGDGAIGAKLDLKATLTLHTK